MPEKHSIYKDIAKRCGGDVYIGVVGPVRTGKSTFIKRFMETLVLPNIENEYDRKRAQDELPQSASGRTVMTTEPKFIPDEAVRITPDGGVSTLNVKMIDCVGYLVGDALGSSEDGHPRMVNTPWSEEAMPFEEAAELGTRKVITEHSTIGILVTCDGTICDLEREQYVAAEERAVRELSAINKPFALLLNSARPDSPEAEELALSLEAKYHAPVALVNCLTLDREDINHILEMVLYEFPIVQVGVNLPTWTEALNDDHPLLTDLRGQVLSLIGSLNKIGELKETCAAYQPGPVIRAVTVDSVDLSCGKAAVTVALTPEIYYRTISEQSGLAIEDDAALIRTLVELAGIRKKYDRIAAAMEEVEKNGYGIVVPQIRDMKLEDPKIVRHSGGYGVRLKASAPSIHMIRATIETEIDPVVGSEQQSEELLRYLLSEFEEDPTRIWQTNLFGKTLYELVNEGLNAKLANMPDEARGKLSETLGRIINEGAGGLICIIL